MGGARPAPRLRLHTRSHARAGCVAIHMPPADACIFVRAHRLGFGSGVAPSAFVGLRLGVRAVAVPASHPGSRQALGGGAGVRELVGRSRLNGALMLWCIAYAASTNWAWAPSPMLQLLHHVFRGWGQSRINEKGNKVLRDCECRQGASKARALETLRPGATTIKPAGGEPGGVMFPARPPDRGT